MSLVSRLSRAYHEIMDGHDGKLSFTKHMLVAVFWVYVLGHPLPAWLTLVLILASKSVSLLYEWLIRLPWTPGSLPLSALPISSATSASPAARTTDQP